MLLKKKFLKNYYIPVSENQLRHFLNCNVVQLVVFQSFAATYILNTYSRRLDLFTLNLFHHLIERVGTIAQTTTVLSAWTSSTLTSTVFATVCFALTPFNNVFTVQRFVYTVQCTFRCGCTVLPMSFNNPWSQLL
jgi:hypothetical protein